MSFERSELRTTHDRLERATRSLPRLPGETKFPGSLAVIWEFANAAQRVEPAVSEMLEVLSELTPRLELAVVDNGSSDRTIEVAVDLAQRYPQLIPVRMSEVSSRAMLLHTALPHVAGEVVLFRTCSCVLDIHATHGMWRAIETSHLVLSGERGRGAMGRMASGIGRILGRKEMIPLGRSGMEMVRRSVIDEIDWTSGHADVTGQLLRTRGYQWTALPNTRTPAGHRFHGSGSRQAAAGIADDRRVAATEGIRGPTRTRSGVAMGAIRDFTLGE